MQASELLSHIEGLVAAREQAKAIYAEQIAPDFTPFQFLDTHETALSRVLAWLLDPQGSHAQGARFLEAFLRWLDAPALLTATNWKVAHVKTEVAAAYSGQDGFIDVLVKAGGCGVAIENKPYAGDQDLQVARYLKDLTLRCPRAQCLVYLSRYGDGPSESSLSAEEMVSERETGRLCIRSYSDLTVWLETCAGVCRAQSVVMLIRGFATFIQKEFEGVSNRDEVESLASTIIASPERLNAALALFEAQGATRERLMARFVADVENKVAEKSGWTIARADIGDGANTGLSIALPDVEARFGIRFHRSAYRFLYYGVEVPGGGRLEPKVKKAVDTCLGKGNATEWWPFWKEVRPNDRFFPIDQSLNREFWLMLNDGRLADMIVDFVDEIARCLPTR